MKRSLGSLVSRKDIYLYALALPGLLYFLLFKYLPLGGLTLAFREYGPYLGLWRSPWVGLDHFKRLFADEDFFLLIRNTLVVSTLNLAFFFPFSLILALSLLETRVGGFRKAVQTIIYLPHFLSWVIVSGLTFMLLSQSEGLFNKIAVVLGRDTVGFLTDPAYFWGIVTVQSVWKEAGWGTIIFLAAAAGIDPQLYEAAAIDGAGRIRRILHVTLPGLRGVIIVMLILRLGTIMDTGFEQIYLMMNGAVSEVAEVFDTYVYRVGIQNGQFSYGTAIGLFKSVVGVILVVITDRAAKAYGYDGLLYSVPPA